MVKENVTKSLGETSRTLLIWGGIIIVVIITVVIVINIVRKPVPPEEAVEEIQRPVYEVVVEDIKFKLKTAKDRGNILEASESKYTFQEDLITTEKFIEVTISAENIGKEDIQSGSWEIKELIGSEGRKFSSSGEMDPWIPEESKCGALLKPGFSPILCTKIYEVATISTDLKVRVSSRQQEGEDFFLDLGF